VIRVGVLGAAGRMGRIVSSAVVEDPDLTLVAAVNPGFGGEEVGGMIGRPDVDLRVSDDIQALAEAGTEVAVDFTTPGAVMDNIRWAIEHGMHIVVGTTGIGPDDLAEIELLLQKEGNRWGVVVAPNFALGAVLLQRFAEQAARFLPAAEIIELHHEGKLDAPSGTALATAERLARARGADWDGPPGESIEGVRGGQHHGIRIHSVRLPGLVAHQEVIFGAEGQTLSIRHDAPQRTAYVPGVLMAVKVVPGRPGLTVGLEPLMDADRPQA
jgi:4-hydroxy-tetrahydrodipicolinate reductase